MATINLNVGKGFTFNKNKLSLNWFPDFNIIKNEDGVYIPDMSGKPGNDKGAISDNWTTIPSPNGGLKINRAVVQSIYAMSCWKVLDRTLGSYKVDYTVFKTKADVIEEINSLIDSYDYSCYKMKAGDLFMFRSEPVTVEYNGWTKTCDDGKRYNWAPCLALYSVDAITYSGSIVTDITFTCLWYNHSKFNTSDLLTN